MMRLREGPQLGLAEEYIWVSQERKMCCANGHLPHRREVRALDGPVFNYTQSKLD